MKLTIERAPLLKALDAARRISEARSTIPILSNILLATDNGKLRIEATDLDIEMRISIDADIDATGALTVSSATLHDLVRKLADKSVVTLEQDDAVMHLRSGRTRARLSTLPSVDWPSAIAPDEWAATFFLPAGKLASMLSKTAFAISNEETRYYLNGTFMHFIAVEGRLLLRMVTTDGHRLARIEMEAPAGAETMPGIIIPKKAGAEIEKLSIGFKGDAILSVSQGRLRVELGDIALSTKLIDGTFPDYNRVIPQWGSKVATLERTVFASAADRVSTVASERGRAVKLSFGNEQLTLSVTDANVGEARDELDAIYDADPMEIGFNSRYLADALSVVEGDTVCICLADPGSPALLKSATQEDLLIVLMPMRV